MKSLKITLTFAALVALFFVTVSGLSPEKDIDNTTEFEKDEIEAVALGVKKNKKPSQQYM